MFVGFAHHLLNNLFTELLSWGIISSLASFSFSTCSFAMVGKCYPNRSSMFRMKPIATYCLIIYNIDSVCERAIILTQIANIGEIIFIDMMIMFIDLPLRLFLFPFILLKYIRQVVPCFSSASTCCCINMLKIILQEVYIGSIG